MARRRWAGWLARPQLGQWLGLELGLEHGLGLACPFGCLVLRSLLWSVRSTTLDREWMGLGKGMLARSRTHIGRRLAGATAWAGGGFGPLFV